MPCVTLADGVPVTIELEEKDQFKLTPEKLLEKITDKTKILVLPFPNNPTGAYYGTGRTGRNCKDRPGKGSVCDFR
ncbi:MAG: aminotransferase class I/II-fold pyridoxal phosphate-dependent enzyme [Enterocloster sp.]